MPMLDSAESQPDLDNSAVSLLKEETEGEAIPGARGIAVCSGLGCRLRSGLAVNTKLKKAWKLL